MINFKRLTGSQLKKIIHKAQTELNNKTADKMLYPHDCYSSPSYHLKGYRHWAKKIDSVDMSKTDESALEGEFLNVSTEYELPLNSVIIEARGQNGVIVYILENNGKSFFSRDNKVTAQLIKRIARLFFLI